MRLAPFALLALTACAPAPDLGGRLSDADRTAPYPALVPLGPLLAAADASGTVLPPGNSLDTRIARLSARAAILRAPVLTSADRARLGL
jgi:hypothetical protein